MIQVLRGGISMKKRITSWILTFSILLSILPLNVLTASAANTLYGDADGNGTVELADVNLMESYLAGDADAQNSIHLDQADVNGDGKVDQSDVTLVKEYLAGNTQLTNDLCTVSFDTQGGGDLPPIQVGRGYAIMQDIPSPAKEDGIFVGWKQEDGSDFYPSQPITTNMTLTAAYEPVDSGEQVYIDTFALTDQDPSLELLITAPGKTAQEVKAALTLLTKDGSDPVNLEVADKGSGSFGVTAQGGFRAGGTYELTLGEGLSFTDHDARYRTVALTFTKEEEDTIQFSDDVIFIQDNDAYGYYLDPTDSYPHGQSLDVLDIPIYASGEAEVSTGYIYTTDFDSPLNTAALEEGSVVCVYENVDPRDRDYTTDLYEGDSIAYIRITQADHGSLQDGITTPSYFYFESLGEEDLDEVILMPDTIPYQVQQLPDHTIGSTGTVDANGYDHSARAALGLTDAPAFRGGDLLVFYTQEFALLTADSPAVYAKVTGVTDDTTVHYEVIRREDIESLTGGLFVSTSITLDESATQAMQQSLAEGLENSSFTQEAVSLLAAGALQTPSIRAQLLEMGVTQEEINLLAAQPMAAGGSSAGKTKFAYEGSTVRPSPLIHDRYSDGYGVRLEVSAAFSVSKKVASGQTSTLYIEASACFEQQGAFGLNVDVDTDWKVYFIIPVLKEVSCSVSVDIKSYTNISLMAKTYTVSQEKREAFNDFIDFVRNGEYTDALRELNELRVQRKLGGGKDVADQIDGILNDLPKINVNGTEYSYEQLEQELNMTDVSSEFEGVLSAETEEDNKVGVEQLMSKYSELFNNESDWAQILNRELFSKQYHIKILAIKLSVNFIVRTDVNLTMGADLEYEVGKRYNFWVKIFSGKSGSSETDLLDERFGFQFYIMGYVGVKAGFKIDVAVGIISTSIASVGVNVEFGPYVKMYGYFVYIYIKERLANTPTWNVTERKMGAIYLEFGLYLTVKFKAQALKDLVKYEPTLYDGEFPLMRVGSEKNVYDFALSPTSSDLLYILDENQDYADGITMALPEAYRNMKTIRMTSGERAQDIYDLSNFHVRFTNPAFSMDNQGVIHFDKDSLPQGTRYVQGDMIITWMPDKRPFSKYDIAITVPVVWTSYSQSEISKLFNVYVAVGNSTYGYQTVWSHQYNRLQSFDLPTQAEILEMIQYDAYTGESGGNLKYANTGSYTVSNLTGLTVSEDTTFYYEIPLKEYTLTVNNIQEKDGTLSAKSYTTIYGEPFAQLASLANTGANDPDSDTYTAFLNLTSTKTDEIFELGSRVNLAFIEKYGSSATFTANYQDAGRTATFRFMGVSVPDYTVQFRAGTTPQAGNLMEHISQYVEESVSITDISPAVAASDSSVTYTVTCEPLPADTPTYSLNFVVQPSADQSQSDMPQIPSVEYPKGSVVFEPKLPTLSGAYLNGWYTDEACTQPYDFTTQRMPDRDVTLYAQYISTMVTVHIMENATTELETRQVPNGSALGALPQISGMTSTQRLMGWYDNPSFTGQAYTADTILRSDQDIYLYPYVTEKLDIGLTADLFTPVTKTYDRMETRLDVEEVLKEYLGTEYYNWDFQVLWRKQGSDITTTEWTETTDYTLHNWPSAVGGYDVRITWPGNETYKPLDLFLDGFIRIEKAPFPISSGDFLLPPTTNATFHSVAVYLPENFSPYNFQEDNTVTVRIQYLQTNFAFADYETYTMPLAQGNTASDKRFIKSFTLDESRMVSPYKHTPYDLTIRVRLEISDGTSYYGTTTPYVETTVVDPNIGRQSFSAPSAFGTLSVSDAMDRLSLPQAPQILRAPSDDNSLTLTGQDVKTMAGKTFGISLNLDNNPGLWGIWANVERQDDAPFDMVGYTVGTAFPNTHLTVQQDWGANPLKFVVTNDTLTDLDTQDSIITFWYVVREDAQPGHYPVTVNLSEAVNAQGEATASVPTQLDVWVAESSDFVAQAPEVTLMAEEEYIYAKGNTADSLYLNATAEDGGTLSYQWYRYTDDASDATAIPDADAPTYTPPTDTAGITHYYCRVTNTLDTIDGERTAYTDSFPVSIEVLEQECVVHLNYNRGTLNGMDGRIITTTNGRLPQLDEVVPVRDEYSFMGWFTQTEEGEKVTTDTVFRQAEATVYAQWVLTGTATDAQAPDITSHTPALKLDLNNPTNSWLSVSAEVDDGGELFYQWYQTGIPSNQGGTPINHAVYHSYTPDTSQEGITYYYCVVTNRNTGPSVTGNQYVSSRTDAIPVYVGTAYVTFDPQEGVVTPTQLPLSMDLSTGALSIRTSLPVPTREGYAFTGWYTQPQGGDQVDAGYAFPNAITVYGQWSPNALTPVIHTQPEDQEVVIHTYPSLYVEALQPTDGGVLTYQWYRCQEDGSNAQAVPGETDSFFAGTPDTLGTFYYFCTVTNTNRNVIGSQTASVQSEIVRMNVVAPTGVVDAAAPTVNMAALDPAVYGKNAVAEELVYSAIVLDGGVVTYQWYVSESQTGQGTAIDGATQPRFTPPTDIPGTFYYYCVATNTNEFAFQTKTASTTSNRVDIVVQPLEAPTIVTQPISDVYRVGDPAVPLVVKAEEKTDYTLSYQWYQNEFGGNKEGTPIPDATQTTVTPTTDTESSRYYFCQVTATYPGGETVTTRSQAAHIYVTSSSSGEFIVTFDPNGGTVTEHSLLTSRQKLTSLPQPWREGYDFDGWYTQLEGGLYVTTDNLTYSQDTTLYAHWTQKPLADAGAPVISTQPDPGPHEYLQGQEAEALTVTAASPDGGTLSYQWYQNTSESTTGGVPVGTDSPSYTPSTQVAGTSYYYCVVTNTNADATGSTTAVTITDTVKIVVQEPPHTHQGTWVPGTEPTCTQPGIRGYYRCTCGKFFGDKDCTQEITDLDTWKVIPALGHDFGPWETVTPATCTSTGQEQRTCSRCDQQETRDIPMLEHTWSQDYSKENADADRHYHVCTACHARDEGQPHTWNVEAATQDTDKHCTVCGYVAQAQLGHTHQGTWVPGTEPTCTQPGARGYYRCSCGKSFEDAACTQEITDLDAWKVIPALGHDFQNGVCTQCGATQEQPPAPSEQPTTVPSEQPTTTPEQPTTPPTQSPATGDPYTPVVWMTLLMAAGTGLCGLILSRKRKNAAK